ncbi:UNVERIFIED_CONTAM: hypothetical protein Sangu_0931000 [Sesamum angustifolium]|uniref:Sucrase/ferredoxin-like family protein n=1 Tax=Sesamum angustifolium TaxID=2727405 RepID=A0AAW2PCA2_9LAMI
MSNPLMASNRDDPSSLERPPPLLRILPDRRLGNRQLPFRRLPDWQRLRQLPERRISWRGGPLVGTVELYERHVFLCYKNPQVWPPRIEAAEFDRLPRLLAAALAARKPDMKRQTRLTICEGRDGTETSNGDVLIFPDMIRYRRLTHFDVETFVEEVLVKDGEWLPGSPEALRGWYIFVCCHGTRDRRCGVCGPSVISKFKNEIESRGMDMLCPKMYLFLLEQHIGKGEIVDFLWRGQMGLSEEDQKKSQELRFQVNGGSTMDRSMKESAQVNEGSVGICASQVEGTGCCQVNGGFSCCQNSVSQGKRLDPDSTAISTAEKKKSSKKQVSRNNSGKGTGPRKVCSMPTWYENWEREDTYAALAVICAAMSVAFAYRCYKQLS